MARRVGPTGLGWPIAVLALAAAAVVVLAAHRRLSPTWPATVLTLAALAAATGFLPSGPTLAASGASRSYEPVSPGMLPGLTIAIAALLVACVAWVITSDRQPPRPRARRVDRELASG
jgi:hypothetical protein